MKFKADIYTNASATVEFEIPDEKLKELANELGKTIDELTADDLIDLTYEHMDTPNLCAQCSGWDKKYGLELGDEWEIVEGTEKYPSIRKAE